MPKRAATCTVDKPLAYNRAVDSTSQRRAAAPADAAQDPGARTAADHEPHTRTTVPELGTGSAWASKRAASRARPSRSSLARSQSTAVGTSAYRRCQARSAAITARSSHTPRSATSGISARLAESAPGPGEACGPLQRARSTGRDALSLARRTIRPTQSGARPHLRHDSSQQLVGTPRVATVAAELRARSRPVARPSGVGPRARPWPQTMRRPQSERAAGRCAQEDWSPSSPRRSELARPRLTS